MARSNPRPSARFRAIRGPQFAPRTDPTPATPDPSVTGPRLGRSTLAYLVGITLLITLAPFRFSWADRHGLSVVWSVSDAVMNVVMFVPLGFVFGLARPAHRPAHWWRVVLWGALFSAAIEALQLLAPTRYASPVDLLTNAAGAGIGAWLHRVTSARLAAATAVRSLALELPVMGLVYLLVPLLWLVMLAAGDDLQAWLGVPLTAMAGAILGAVHAGYLAPSRVGHVAGSRAALGAAAVAWVAVAWLPALARGEVRLVIAALAVGVGVAWLRAIATTRLAQAGDGRRFERPTLRLVLPLFAAYLVLQALWPLRVVPQGWTLLDALYRGTGDSSHRDVFRALQHLAAFTLVGYIIAEYHGRTLARYRHVAWRVARWGGGLALLLEAVRGWHPDHHASPLLALAATMAALVGGRLYQLQRDHVRALLHRGSA